MIDDKVLIRHPLRATPRMDLVSNLNESNTGIIWRRPRCGAALEDRLGGLIYGLLRSFLRNCE